MRATARLRFAAAACSRRVGALATLPSTNIAAYASSTNVFVVKCPENTVIAVLPAHSSPVTALTLHASPSDGSAVLLAAASDGALTAWRGVRQPSPEWQRVCTWVAHDSQPCVSLAACELSGSLAVVTAGMEGDLKLWMPNNDLAVWNCTMEAAVASRGSVLLECVAIRSISPMTAIVVAGGTDARVWVFDATLSNSDEMHPVAVLHGHRDWIRGLAFSDNVLARSGGSAEEQDFYFASASKDGTARVWRVEKCPRDGAEDPLFEHTTRVSVELAGESWSFVAVALLDEHTAAVHSVAFSEVVALDADQLLRPKLVTSSMDCTVGIWEASQEELWNCTARFGLMGGSSAHALGFFGACFSTRDGNEVLGHNFGGALHCWRAAELGGEELNGNIEKPLQFFAQPAPGGHFAPVMDVGWEPQGRYLLTCSTDKTARIFIEVDNAGDLGFVEWARPQVHGHSIFAVAFCDGDGQKYASGAEERMIRLFEAPSSFRLPGEATTDSLEQKATAAVVPELGLSNKAMFDNVGAGKQDRDQQDVSSNDMEVTAFGAQRGSSKVPLEEDLKQKRLWPETAKLYGHGNEIACLTADNVNLILASACRAQTGKDATIHLWDIESGVEGGRLSCHDLTVNHICFSEDGNQLLSVSRDRSFAIFKKTGDSKFSFALVQRKRSAHSRSINCGGWVLEDKYIVTGSRDKCVKVFSVTDDEAVEVFKKKFSSGVTALDTFALSGVGNRCIVAAGFESGALRVFSAQQGKNSGFALTQLFETDDESRCGLRVNGVQWRPKLETEKHGATTLQLAVVSEDCSVRVFEFRIETDDIASNKT